VLNAAGTVVASSTTSSVALTGLTASTQYVLRVRARDGAGNLSAPSAAVTFSTSTPGGGGGGCTAAYSISNQWAGGFQASVTVTNTAATASTSWQVTWTFANGQTITQLWGGQVSQAGANVTVTNLSWNGALAPNASTTFGFLANWSGSNATPTVSCSRTP
jgi:cellulose 1,4-beta-cellobiosidase